MKIRFYGKLGEQLGAEIDIDPPVGTNTVLELRELLVELFPEATIDLRDRSRACIADSIVSEGHNLRGVVAVEFFPPLSGG